MGHCFKRRANLGRYFRGWRRQRAVDEEGVFCYCGLVGHRIYIWGYREEGRCRCWMILWIFYGVCFYKGLSWVTGVHT